MDKAAGNLTYGTGTYDEGVVSSGWQRYAGFLILFTGVWNAFEGVFAFFRSAYFAGSAVFGSLWIWAIIWTVFGVLLIAAGSAILTGQTWGRWFGIIVVLANAFIHLMAIGTYPWWSLVVIAIDVTVIYALTARWQSASPQVG
jgi:hypothetical protein